MQVNNVLSAYQVTANNTANANPASNELDSGQFMQILLAQLTHQNPLEPMDNAEMMSQFSQLNSLQELRGINTSMESVSVTSQTTYLTSLVGKTVKASRADGKVIEGVVEGVATDVENPQVLVGDEVVDLIDILEIKAD
ncbi:MAG TPA: flagellar hook capping FlgD N-terminal domain-containing protein [Anaerolineales bacterium]|nr:flagellar hook capping FlgD N-terminal domain-containing protein [Anaerolineales bacterium]HMZ06461.1 flagellar hook capping FlgD N-terminal domain-containing protein [Anaerolineales bacterium]HNA88139.1 flagellar hook capping FlgD N-terminal domain-containing protein [Anaerolineales bacterium]HNB35699.1 flagellar hook capping FlgD N-terminal domain-containing protein [Anaerolineales bacterium]HNC90360.1 flagellar hook capping FlgD N-terminal domain-containing protein [Anaerolineales bacteri